MKSLAVIGVLYLSYFTVSAQNITSQASSSSSIKLTKVLLSNRPAPRTVLVPDLPKIKAKPPIRNFTNYTTQEGLALASVYAALRDDEGNLWFGTLGGGVSKFDGKRFTNFGTSQGLSNGVVRAIAQDNQRNYYFGTGAGVSVYDGVRIKNYGAADGMVPQAVSALIVDATGKLWIGTMGGGLVLFDQQKFKAYTSNDQLADNTVRCLAFDKDSLLWIGTAAGVSTFDGKTLRTITNPELSGKIVYDIHLDSKGSLWFAMAEGLVKFSEGVMKRFTVEDGLAAPRVLSIGEDNNGILWFGMHEGGVSRFDGSAFETITAAEGLPSNRIWSIIKDAGGNMWFCSQGKGVSRYNGGSLMSYTSVTGLAHNMVWSVLEDKKGNVLFGTEGGLSHFDGEFFRNLTYDQGLPQGAVASITLDPKGIIWFGGTSGLTRWDGLRLTNYTEDQGLSNNHITDVVSDNAHSIWVATAEGVSKFDGTSFTNYTLEENGNNQRARALFIDQNQTVWVSSTTKLFRYDQEEFVHVPLPDTLENFTITSITQDKNGFFWFGCGSKGIIRYDGSTFLRFASQHGFPNDVVYDIDLDEATGDLWVGTNLGFTKLLFQDEEKRMLPPGLIAVKNEGLSIFNLVWHQYNRSTGFALEDLNSGAMLISNRDLKNGRPSNTIIWGGFGDNKLVRFDPGLEGLQTAAPKLSLTRIKLNGRTIPWNTLARNQSDDSLRHSEEILDLERPLTADTRQEFRNEFKGVSFSGVSKFSRLPENLILPYHANQVSFDFHAIETSRNFLIDYQFRLTGQQNDWSVPGKEGHATFTNLWEGNYTFEVRAKAANGAWTDVEQFSFSVKPPWWRSLPMYVVYFIGVFGGAISFIKVRERLHRKEKNALESLIAERTHEANIQKEEALRQKRMVEERNEEIQVQLDQTERDLGNQAIDMIQRNSLLKDIEAEVSRLAAEKNAPQFSRLMSLVNVTKAQEKEWETFNHYFNFVHHDFYSNLRQRCPALSDYEQRLAALVRMSMDNKQIAALLNIEVTSVKMAKYRLKKKLELEEADDLFEFLSAL